MVKKMINRIDHVGIAVHSLEEVKEYFKKLFRLEPEFEEEVPEQKVKVIGFRIGESLLEFLEPLREDSPISNFLTKKGEGIHHLAVNVEDIEEILQRLKDSEVKLINESPIIGAEGKKIAFVHPRSNFGMLLELSQDKEK